MSFEPKSFYSSVVDVPAASQELWLLRFPRKFPLKSLPKKIKLHLKKSKKHQEGGGDDAQSVANISVNGREFEVVASATPSKGELGQLHAIVGEGDELEFGPKFTHQVNIVEKVAVPQVPPQNFQKPIIPPFHGTLTLQGTPSGYGLTPVKTQPGAAATTTTTTTTTTTKAASKKVKAKRAAGAAPGARKPSKRSSSDVDNEMPVNKKSKRSGEAAEAEAASSDEGAQAEESAKKSRKSKSDKKKKSKKKKTTKKKKSKSKDDSD